MTHSLLGVRALKGSPPNGRAVSLERTDNVGGVHRAWEVVILLSFSLMELCLS